MGYDDEIQYGLSISTFRGIVPGTQHFYGTLWRYDPDAPKGEKHFQRTNVMRELSEEDAKLLNEQDVDWPHHRAGQDTKRWNDWRGLLDASLRQAKEKWGSVELQIGDEGMLDNPTVNLAEEPFDKTVALEEIEGYMDDIGEEPSWIRNHFR